MTSKPALDRGDQFFERRVSAFHNQAAATASAAKSAATTASAATSASTAVRFLAGFFGPVAIVAEIRDHAFIDVSERAGRQPIAGPRQTTAAADRKDRCASVMDSGNTFSPSKVPPPRFERNVRPSSVDRARKCADHQPHQVAARSRLQHDRVIAGRQASADSSIACIFQSRSRRDRALSIAESFIEGCPAHPELDPSAMRMVVVNCESLELWNPKSPALLAIAVTRWDRSIRPGRDQFLLHRRVDDGLHVRDHLRRARIGRVLVVIERFGKFLRADGAKPLRIWRRRGRRVPRLSSPPRAANRRPDRWWRRSRCGASRVVTIDRLCRSANDAVVMPLLANRVYACSCAVMVTWHSGNVDIPRTFLASFCASSWVSMALIRERYVDLAEARRRASVADGIDLRRLAFRVARGAELPPIGRPGGAVAGLPEIGRARLIGHARNHAALLAALDLPERVAAELEVVALLIDGITAPAVDQDAVVDAGDQVLQRGLASDPASATHSACAGKERVAHESAWQQPCDSLSPTRCACSRVV